MKKLLLLPLLLFSCKESEVNEKQQVYFSDSTSRDATKEEIKNGLKSDIIYGVIFFWVNIGINVEFESYSNVTMLRVTTKKETEQYIRDNNFIVGEHNTIIVDSIVYLKNESEIIKNKALWDSLMYCFSLKHLKPLPGSEADSK